MDAAASIEAWMQSPVTSLVIVILSLVLIALTAHSLRHRLGYWKARDRHPTFREYMASMKLQRDIASGKKGRGRTPPVVTSPPRWRAPWLEFCLRLRILRSALASFSPLTGGTCAPVGRLYIRHKKANGDIDNHGLVSTKVVTNVGVAYIVDAFQNTVELENMKYHAIGTTNTAENVADTTMALEVESRATGTTTEGASANIYRTVGEVTTASARAVVEHGVFSAVSGGVLLDRSVFSVINTGPGDSIEFTYELTLTAGS